MNEESLRIELNYHLFFTRLFVFRFSPDPVLVHVFEPVDPYSDEWFAVVQRHPAAIVAVNQKSANGKHVNSSAPGQ